MAHFSLSIAQPDKRHVYLFIYFFQKSLFIDRFVRLTVRLSPPTRLRLIGPRTFLLFFSFLDSIQSTQIVSNESQQRQKIENVEFKLHTQLSVCVCVVFDVFLSGACI
jgi:hypothetical protein